MEQQALSHLEDNLLILIIGAMDVALQHVRVYVQAHTMLLFLINRAVKLLTMYLFLLGLQ